jgi:hypothetical protein
MFVAGMCQVTGSTLSSSPRPLSSLLPARRTAPPPRRARPSPPGDCPRQRRRACARRRAARAPRPARVRARRGGRRARRAGAGGRGRARAALPTRARQIDCLAPCLIHSHSCQSAGHTQAPRWSAGGTGACGQGERGDGRGAARRGGQPSGAEASAGGCGRHPRRHRGGRAALRNRGDDPIPDTWFTIQNRIRNA